MKIEIKSLHVYPVKSCGVIDLVEATIGQRGFVHDRNWMIVEPDGKKITQREVPLLALIEPKLNAETLTLRFANFSSLEIPLAHGDFQKRSVNIWGHECLGLDEGEDAAQWLSSAIGKHVRLVRFDSEHVRSVDAKWVGESGAHTGFSDVLPYLITSEDSLAALNQLRQNDGLPLTSMKYFRPNIVIAGVGAFGEEIIPALRIPDSGVTFELVRPCDRCPIININQEKGEREKRGNLQILAEQRLFKNRFGKTGAMFGVQAFTAPVEGCTVSVGDSFEVVDLSPDLPPLPRLFELK